MTAPAPTPGQAAYEATHPFYGQALDDDLQWVPWERMPAFEREAWEAAAQAAIDTTELARLQRACQTLGMVVERQARDLYAMWIDVSRGDLEAVKERVLNSIPDYDDNEPDQQWNGTETGGEWFERTDERFARGGIVSPAPGGDSLPLRNGGCMP